MTFRFLGRRIVEVVHQQQLERHGGAPGIRDEGLFESALNRPLNKAVYGCDDIYELAAGYLFRICRNHAFVDGNKRIAIVTAGVFLADNGLQIETDNATLYAFVTAVAAGEIDETGIAAFLRDHSVATDD